MRQLSEGSLEDKARELVAIARGMISNRDNIIIQLRQKLEEAEQKLAEVRRRATNRYDGRLKEVCMGCIFRIEYEKRLQQEEKRK